MTAPAGWGRRRSVAAIALVRWPSGDVDVHLADDEEALTKAVALRVLAATPPGELGAAAGSIRDDVLAGNFAEAIVTWMGCTGARIDAFPDEKVWSAADVSEENFELELGLTRLFSDGR